MKRKSKTLTPKLRFPEFEGQPWRAVNLQEVTEECATRNGDKLSSGSVMGVTKAQGIIPMEERTIGADLSRYKLVRNNWFAYNPMRLNIGSIARWSGNADVLVSPDYVVFRCLEEASTGIDPEYLDHFRRSERWDDFVTGSGIGSVRVRIYYKDIGRLRVPLPEPAEQRKIAACLTSVDEWIAAEGRKLEALRAHKKGLMQRLFPRENETRPRLRFPEFRNGPKWEDKKLDDLAQRGSGHTPNKGKPEYYNGGLKWVSLADSRRLDRGLISQTEIEISEQGIENSSAVLHPEGSVILSRDAGVGKSAIMACQMAVSQHFIVWTCDPSKLSNWFLYHLFQRMKPLFERIATGSTIKTIGLPFFIEMRLAVPSVQEQERIAACLSSLDALIAAQSRKVDGLRAHKKGLMQQLFPSPEGV